jgi:hypothetical protein
LLVQSVHFVGVGQCKTNREISTRPPASDSSRGAKRLDSSEFGRDMRLLGDRKK